MLIDIHNHIGADLMFYFTRSSPYAQELPALVADGDPLGVTHWAVFPFVLHLGFNVEAMRTGKLETAGAMETVPYAFENARLLHEIYVLYPEHAPRMLPFLMADPLRNPDAQIAALRQLIAQHRVSGLKIQSTMLRAPIKNLLGPARGLLELSVEFNLPWIIHSSIAPSDLWAQASDILDIAEAWPQVRFCLAHSCRYDQPSLDRLAELPNAWFDCSAHNIHCRCAAENNLAVVASPERRFKSDYRNPGRVLQDLAEAYPTKLMWGSDSPFYSYVAQLDGAVLALKSSYADEVASLRALPAALQHRITHENPLRFLQLSDERLLTRQP